MSLVALLISAICGTLGIMYYIPHLGTFLKDIGFYMPQLRSLHTTFAMAWVYVSAIAFVEYFLDQRYPERRTRAGIGRRKARVLCWGTAGLLAFVTLAMGIFSGREYVEYHPTISLFIFFGWLCFTYDLIRRVRSSFWEQPVYIYMWTVGALLFLYAYAESHLWLIGLS